MGIDILNHAMSKDGDLPSSIGFQSASQTYVGGQPCGLAASGITFGTDVTDAQYVGVLINSSLEDTRVGSGQHVLTTTLANAKPTIYWARSAGAKVKLFQKTRHDAADANPPFETSVTWALNDSLYISTNGKWTNVTGTNRTTAWGRVLKAPASATDDMIAILY